MDNSGSSKNSENEDEDISKKNVGAAEKDIGENIANLDLTVLFDPTQFRGLKIKKFLFSR